MAADEPAQVATPVVDEKQGSEEDAHSFAPPLTEDEKKIIDRQLYAPNEKVGYFSLFRYANKKEVAIMAVSAIASIAAGACLPLMTVSYSKQN